MEVLLILGSSGVGILFGAVGFWHTGNLLSRSLLTTSIAIDCTTTYFVATDYSIWQGVLHAVLYTALTVLGVIYLHKLTA